MNFSKMLGGMVASLAAFALVLTPVMVSAAVEQSNDTTGPHSNNVNRLRVRNRHTVNKTNRATLNNTAVVVADTGGNQQNKNTTAGNQTSGDVTATLGVTNTANQNNDCPCPTPDPVVVDGTQSNTTTGPHSNNVNSIKVSHTSSMTLTNNATINNNAVVVGTTGDNKQNQNTTGGDQTSGNVTVGITANNTAN